MDTRYPARIEDFRNEVRSYFEDLVRRFGGDGSTENRTHYRALVRQLGADGWLGISLGEEWGGGNRSAVEQLIVSEEAERAGVSLPFLTTHTVGPLIQRFGSAEQKERFLPAIVRGEILFSIGYTETQAGTDLASLSTSAVPHASGYVVNGEKLFTSFSNVADYVWLAARTDPQAPPHRGISVLLVPTDAPGYSWTPLDILDHYPVSVTRYENVVVPSDNLVGGEGNGWKLIMGQLSRERVLCFTVAGTAHMVEQVTQWARRTVGIDGRRIIDRPWVQTNLARMRAHLEVSRLHAAELAAALDQGEIGFAQSSSYKVFASETLILCQRLLLEILGAQAPLRGTSPMAVLEGKLIKAYNGYLVKQFGGGANDILRGLIATDALAFPRIR